MGEEEGVNGGVAGCGCERNHETKAAMTQMRVERKVIRKQKQQNREHK